MAGMYCKQDDIETRISLVDLAKLTNDRQDETAVDVVVLASLINQAGVDIDGALQGIFETPLSPTPDIITNLAVSIVIWRAFARRSASIEMPAHIQKEYDLAMETLNQISTLETYLGDGYPVLTSQGQMIAPTARPKFDFDNTDIEKPGIAWY